jgi:hypothetical protein
MSALALAGLQVVLVRSRPETRITPGGAAAVVALTLATRVELVLPDLFLGHPPQEDPDSMSVSGNQPW